MRSSYPCAGEAPTPGPGLRPSAAAYRHPLLNPDDGTPSSSRPVKLGRLAQPLARARAVQLVA